MAATDALKFLLAASDGAKTDDVGNVPRASSPVMYKYNIAKAHFVQL